MAKATAARARELFVYDPETGDIRWRLDRFCGRNGKGYKRASAGDIAGSIDPTVGYRRLHFDGQRYWAHRVIWLMQTGEWPAAEVDHRDNDRLNNRWKNLRQATHAQNVRNTKRRRSSRSGFKGVYWTAQKQCWTAVLTVNGRRKHLGFFDAPREAHDAYVAAANHHFGEFANPGDRHAG